MREQYKNMDTQSFSQGINEMILKKDKKSIHYQMSPDYTVLRILSVLMSVINTHQLNIQSVLEVGCGIGKFTHFLKTLFGHVLAFDASDEAIRLAKLNAPGSDLFCTGDAIHPDFLGNQKFDLIFMVQFHLLKRSILGNASQKTYDQFYNDFIAMYRSYLNPNGILFVSHGINADTHYIRPEKLITQGDLFRISVKRPALESLFPNKLIKLAHAIDKLITYLFSKQSTTFYIINR